MNREKVYEESKNKTDPPPRNYTPDSFAKELIKGAGIRGNISYSIGTKNR